MTLPKLSDLVWPGIVALSLIALFTFAVHITKQNTQLTDQVNSLNTRIDNLKKEVDQAKQTNDKNTGLYTGDKKADVQLIKSSGRKDLLFEKPGLIELKINDSFDTYMQDFDK